MIGQSVPPAVSIAARAAVHLDMRVVVQRDAVPLQADQAAVAAIAVGTHVHAPAVTHCRHHVPPVNATFHQHLLRPVNILLISIRI